MYKSTAGWGPFCSAALDMFASWVPEKAKKRKRKVPANSPSMAMTWFLTVSGSKRAPGRRLGGGWSRSMVLGWVKGRTTVVAAGGLTFIMVDSRGIVQSDSEIATKQRRLQRRIELWGEKRRKIQRKGADIRNVKLRIERDILRRSDHLGHAKRR
jgi:hypothetical protein